VMARVFRAPTLTLCFLLVTVACFAQSPSPEPAPNEKRSTLTVLLSSDAINTIVRAAGYFPLTEPRKKGTMYVLRVLDHRDVQMRVVVDARSGAISAVNRIAFQRPDSIVGTVPPPQKTSPNEPPPATATIEQPLRDVRPDHAPPDEIGGSLNNPKEGDLSTSPPPSAMVLGTHSILPLAPPLPRPRPSNLKHTAKPNGKMPNASSIKSIFAPAAASTPRAPRSTSAAPRAAPAMPHPRPAAHPGPATPNGVPQIATPD